MKLLSPSSTIPAHPPSLAFSAAVVVLSSVDGELVVQPLVAVAELLVAVVISSGHRLAVVDSILVVVVAVVVAVVVSDGRIGTSPSATGMRPSWSSPSGRCSRRSTSIDLRS